jgi:hypothetical protein
LKSAIAHDSGHPEDLVPGEVVEWRNVRTPGMLAEAIDAQARRLFANRGYAARVEKQEHAPQTDAEPGSEIDARYAYRRDLTQTLEALYDSEIVPTISSDATRDRQYKILTGGLNFAFVDAMQYAGDTQGQWSHVDRASHLAERLHRMARRQLPNTDYGRQAAMGLADNG